jgi:DNA helicase-2/ATP-dependent DNA helicase PcrA
MFHRWHVSSKNQHVLPLVENIIRESGLLSMILSKPEGSVRLRAIDRLYDELQSLAAREPDYSLKSFLEHLDTLTEYKKGLETGAAEERPGVRLMSAHKAKGLEFDHVFILNANERTWEGRTKRAYFRCHLIESPLEDAQDENDERRLFYVALTRARKMATITFSETDDNGKPAIISRFVTDIDPTLLSHTNPIVPLAEGARYAKRVRLEPRALDLEFLRSRFLEQGISATALNNFLDCHWKYVHQNLLRVPGTPNKYLILGTAIHAALRTFFDSWRDGEDIGVEKMLGRMNWSLDRQPISRADDLSLREKGEKALRGYYAQYCGSWPKNIKNEYRINGVHVVLEGEDDPILIPLTGSLDKIEIKEGNRVNVIDYKTGKPKSRNALLGKTKDADTGYIRQLTFYKMLLMKFDKEKYVMETGTIEFIEPNESGKYVREVFDIDDSGVNELEAQVKEVARRIYDLSFWGKRCDNDSCEFCDIYVPLAEKG